MVIKQHDRQGNRTDRNKSSQSVQRVQVRSDVHLLLLVLMLKKPTAFHRLFAFIEKRLLGFRNHLESGNQFR